MLAAQARILRRSLDSSSLRVQDLLIELHGFHCPLDGHNIHFALEALARYNSLLPRAHVKWAGHLHQRAASERHVVFCPGFLGCWHRCRRASRASCRHLPAAPAVAIA